MLNSFIKKYNSFRKEKVMDNRLFNTQKKYAFIGVGMHSLSNIYPVLNHFNITLKYICTQSGKQYQALKKQFPDCIFNDSINDIINDTEVKGVFVCSSPKSHFGILSKLAHAGKQIFIEKPPCQTFEELENLLAIQNTNTCKIGFQRRYWPGNKYILKKIKSAKSYTYTFCFGSYPNGDPYTELFIHALDYCSFLFGAFNVLSFDRQEYDDGITLQIHAKHHNGISALIELSTHFSWNDPIDIMTINCSEEVITAQYPVSVKGKKRPARVMHLPTERIFKQAEITKEYFSTGNLVMPVNEMNTFVLQGFYKELETFIFLVENDVTPGVNDLKDLIPLYKAIKQLKQ
ncbi:MAG: Gfo/Idh/MocA family oxidoreductase [Agriterribacter sp.]